MRPQSTQTLVDQAIEDGCERIVVVGGDGSLHRAVQALRKGGHLGRVALGLVPGGTCNDFARALGLRPQRMEAAMRLACEGKPRPVDLGLLNGELFINNAGFGRPPQPASVRRVKPLRTLRSLKPTSLKVTWDRGMIEGVFYMTMACNAPFFSKGLHFSRNPRIDDGLLDVYLVPRVAKWKLLQRLVLGKLGRPVAFPRVISLRVPFVTVESQEDLWPQADGEPPRMAVRRVAFSVAEEKAMIVSPANARNNSFWSS
jgi:diacylglycerol kinase (ATP)